jgi:hypothetical protein
MTEPAQSEPDSGPETEPQTAPTAAVRARLQEIVPRLRSARHIDPAVQRALADLVDELVRVMDPNAPAAEAAHLAESSAHLVQALDRKHHAGLIAAARDRLEAAATRAETEAPVATGLARRLIDTLANLGI